MSRLVFHKEDYLPEIKLGLNDAYTTRRYFAFLPIHFRRWILYQSSENTVNSSFAFLVQVERISKILQRDWQKFIFLLSEVAAGFVLKTTLSESPEFLLNEGVSETKSCDCKGGKDWWIDVFIIAFEKGSTFQELKVKILYLKEDTTNPISFTIFCSDDNS